ncbi:MAG: hypothetical protein E7184_03630 [Erysipelotrichaceae bacterium]|nr:hypothetical protein [Erysipelotrichaceae bacterium]
MKKHLGILLTSIFMSLLFVFALNTQTAKASKPAWECETSNGSVSLEGTCFFSSKDEDLEVKDGYAYLDFTIANEDTTTSFMNIYYKNITTGGNTAVTLNGSQSYDLTIPVELDNTNIQTVQVSYILSSKPSKINNLYLYVMLEEIAPKASIVVTDKDYTNFTTANFSVTEKDQDDSGIKEIKFLFRKAMISLPSVSDFDFEYNILEDDEYWQTEVTSVVTHKVSEGKVGSYQYCILAKDFANNSAISCSESFKIDTVAPTIKLKSLPDASKWYSNYEVKYSAYDSVKIEKILCYVNGVEIDCTDSNGSFLLDGSNTIDGENEVYLKIIDSVGNYTQTASFKINMINSPIGYEDSYEGELVEDVYKDKVKYVFTIDTTLSYTVEARINDSETWTKLDVNEYVMDKDGLYIVHIKVTDEAGRILEFSSEEVQVDATTPTIKVVDVTGANDMGWHNSEVDFKLEITDTNYRVCYSTDDSNYLPYDHDDVINHLTIADGLNKVYFLVIDQVGHEAKTDLLIKFDATKDTILSSYNGDQLANGQELEIKIDIKNQTSGTKKLVYIDLEGNEVNIENNKFVVTENGKYLVKLVDVAGNESQKEVEISLFHDFSNDYSLSIVDSSWTNDSVEVLINSNNSSKLTSAKAKLADKEINIDLNTKTFVAEENGTYIVEIENEAGYKGTLTIEVSCIDKEQDELKVVTNSNGNWIGRLEFTVSVVAKGNAPLGTAKYGLVPNDGMINEDQLVDLALDQKIIVEEISGEYYLIVIYQDVAGNETTYQSSLIKIDSSLPVGGQIIASPSDYTNQDIVISFVGFKNLSAEGDVTHYYRVTKEGEVSSEFTLLDINSTVTLTEEGTYIIELKGINDFEKESMTALIVTKDVTAPEIKLSANVGADQFTNNLIVEVEVNEEATIEYKFELEGEKSEFVALDGTTIVAENLKTGKNTLTVIATDRAGNIMVATAVYNIDMENPVISFTDERYVYDKGETIGYSISDNSGIKSVRYVLSKEENLSTDASNGFEIINDMLVLPEIEDGKYYLYIEAIDNAGNKSIISKMIILDTTAPVLEGVANNGFYKDSVVVKINELTAYEVYLNGKLLEVAEDTIEVTENGNYHLVVTDELNHKVVVTFVINKESKVIIDSKEINVSNQKYLPILKDEKGYYVELPKGNYPEKKVLLFSKVVGENVSLLNQDVNYIYLSSSVREDLKNGYRLEIEDLTAVTLEANEYGHYGYVLMNTTTLDAANELGISPVVIDNKAVSLITGLTGVISILGIFIINRSRRLVRI